MKRIIAFLAASVLFGIFSLHAAPVSESTALGIARKLFAAQPATKSQSDAVRLVWNGEDAATKAIHPAFYVFSRDGGGFVIIAGDDNVQPVLALSDRNGFKVEGMPENVRWWMERMKEYVRAAKSQSAEVRSRWSNLIDTKSAVSQELVSDEYLSSRTNEWSQNEPFNLKAPRVTGQADQSVTGCLPLAMAEILTWFGSPTYGTGTLEAYNYSYYADDNTGPWGYTIPGYTLSTEYDWTALKSLSTVTACMNASDEVKDNLSQLIYDCGVMLGAEFNSDIHGGTSASDSRVVKAFGDFMGYNKAAQVVSAADYSSRGWTELLKTQVTSHPVLYCGYAPSSEGQNDASHAYVLDGYATSSGEEVFHFNFGWGGFCNGYYSLFTQPTEAGYDFNTNLRALIDFYPAPESTYPVILEAKYRDAEYPGVRLVQTENGYIVYYMIFNRGSEDYNGRIKFVLRKKDGVEEDIDGSIRTFSMAASHFGGGYFGYVRIDDISLGDVVVCYYEDGGAWKLLSTSNPDSTISEWPLVPVPFIDADNLYAVGSYFPFKLKNNDSPYSGTVWTITDPDGDKVVKNQADDEFQFTKAGTYRVEAAVAPAVGEVVVETIVALVKVL